MSQNVNVNLTPGGYPKEFHVSQYDVGRQLVAKVVDSTGDYSIPSGATVVLVGTKPSGFGFTLNGTVSGSTVTFSTTATVTAEYGRIPCEIRITSGETVLGTANCMLIVEMSPHPEGTTDGDGEVIVNQITLLLEQITQQADRAEDAKDDAKASELAAEGYAVGKQNGTEVGPESPYYHNNCKWYGAQFDEALKDYAKIDGYYKDMTVGTAKQLLSDSTTTDSEPYIYRQTAGDGDREEVEEVVGGTVAWNQLSRPIDSASTSYGLTVTPNVDGSVTVNGTSNDSGSINAFEPVSAIANHKYLLRLSNDVDGLSIYTNIGGNNASIFMIRSASANATNTVTLRTANGKTYNNVNIFLMTFDLTQMFGSTIADYIYNLEQATAGTGVAWFKKLFSKSYYPYNAGELMSVKTSAHVTTGFNQWDEEWEVGYWNMGNKVSSPSNIRSKNKIPILPNTTYYCNKAFYFTYYDENGDFLPQSGYDPQGRYQTLDAFVFSTPSNAYYMTFNMGSAYGTTYNHDICINLSDPTRDGEYEPYQKHTYQLDSSLTLRGVPRLADGKLAFDGDVYPPSGEVQRRYGVVDLGTLNWSTYKTNGFVAQLPAIPYQRNNEPPNAICSRFYSWQGAHVTLTDGMATIAGNSVYFVDANYTDAASFKTAMSGVYLVYELATPTTETATPYTAIQVCDPNGTEEWTDERTVQIPVGNVTKYHANLKEKLEEMPAIPTAPSANGTYTLKATVSGGAVTYQWVNG